MASIPSINADVGNGNNDIPQEMSILQLLPTELIMKILDHLDVRTLLLCKRICCFFRNIVSKAAYFQYKIELSVNGMMDGPPGGLDVAARLDRLVRRQAAWDDLKCTEDKSIEMLTGNVWELYGGVFAQATGRDVLTFRRLSSHYRGIMENVWTVDISQIDMRDFTFDNSQDLLVIAEKPRLLGLGRTNKWRHRMHLRRLSTGAVHPSAPTPGNLTYLCDENIDPVSFSFQISGKYLGVLFISGGEEESELVIWDWTTGHVQLNVYGEPFSVRIRSFAFLTDQHIMMAAHVLPVTHEPQPNLLVFDLTIGPFSRAAVDNSPYICSFFCPCIGPWTAGLDIGFQSSPAPSYMPDSSLSAPFFTSPENRIFVVTILLTDGHSIQTFVIFIPSSTLTKHLATLPCDTRRRNIPWDIWGPTGTRMVPSPGHSNIWVCYVYGMRFVAPHEVRETGSTAVRVYDFNSLAIKRAVATTRELDDSTSYVTTATSLDTSGAFEDVVTTSLPYRMRKLSLERDSTVDGGQFGAVMCSEDSLIIVGTGSDHRQFRILTF